MLTRLPDYYDRFRCLAGACPHTCCAKWEVVVDEESAALYRSVPGELGEKLRRCLTEDADGDLCFPLAGERCPFLDGENLCEIHRQLGEEATSVTCQEHPRFTEDYGAFREVTLSASCPAANALLLGGEEPLTFIDRGEAEEEPDGDLAFLLESRQRILCVLGNRSLPLKERLAAILRLGLERQLAWEGWEAEEAAEQFPGMLPAAEAPLFPAAFDHLAELEILEPDWPGILQAAKTAPLPDLPEALLERTAAYFLFRYTLKAINDGDLTAWIRTALFCVAAVERLAGVLGLPEALRRFSCEIEHSDENWDTLLRADWLTEEGLAGALV